MEEEFESQKQSHDMRFDFDVFSRRKPALPAIICHIPTQMLPIALQEPRYHSQNQAHNLPGPPRGEDIHVVETKAHCVFPLALILIVIISPFYERMH